MTIQAVKFRTDGFMTRPFAFGGEDCTDKFDDDMKYRSGLQNYVIDTGLPAGTRILFGYRG